MCFYLPLVCTINSVSLHSFTSCFQNLYKASVIIDGEGTGAQCPSVRRPRNGVFRRLLGVGPFLPEAPAQVPHPLSRAISRASHAAPLWRHQAGLCVPPGGSRDHAPLTRSAAPAQLTSARPPSIGRPPGEV